MGPQAPGVVVVDAGALIAIERGDRAVRVLLQEATEVVVPAGVVAQVWRDGGRQARIAAVLGAFTTVIEPLDADRARAVGVLCAAAGASDVVDGSVAVAALVRRATVITSDPDDLRRLVPSLDLVVC